MFTCLVGPLAGLHEGVIYVNLLGWPVGRVAVGCYICSPAWLACWTGGSRVLYMFTCLVGPLDG